MTRQNLDDIARRTQPGKSNAELGYAAVYDLLFRNRRFEVSAVLEIGVLKGASLYMWEEYFPVANIYGIDIHTYPQFPDGKWSDRIRVFEADQGKPDQLLKVVSLTGETFDFISDDGSHETQDQITSLKTLFPHLRADGIYVIEDIKSIDEIQPHLEGYNYWFAVPHTIGHETDGTILCIIQK